MVFLDRKSPKLWVFLVFCDGFPGLDRCFLFGLQTCAFPGLMWVSPVFRCISRVQGTVTVCGKAMDVNSRSGFKGFQDFSIKFHGYLLRGL